MKSPALFLLFAVWLRPLLLYSLSFLFPRFTGPAGVRLAAHSVRQGTPFVHSLPGEIPTRPADEDKAIFVRKVFVDTRVEVLRSTVSEGQQTVKFCCQVVLSAGGLNMAGVVAPARA